YQRQGQTQNQVQKLADAASLFEIGTPTAVAVVHGTEFQVDVATDGATSVKVTEGRVGVTADGATQLLAAGQFASVLSPFTEPTTAPTATLVPTPEAEPYDRSELAQVAGQVATPSPTTTPQPTAAAQVAEEPEGPEGVEEPERPEHPEHPMHPEHPDHPEHPEKPDKPSKE
ncbi:MAG: FecR domain-containing protein, partial [Anaerolineae bacterium]